jgi:hypothetical protein
VSIISAALAGMAEVAPGLGAILLLHAGVSRLMALDVDGALDASQAALAIADRSHDTASFFGAHAIVALCRFFAGGGQASEAAIAPIAQVAVAASMPPTTRAPRPSPCCAPTPRCRRVWSTRPSRSSTGSSAPTGRGSWRGR